MAIYMGKVFKPGDEVILNNKKDGMVAKVGSRAIVAAKGMHSIPGIVGKLLDVSWIRSDPGILGQHDGGYDIEYFDHVIDVKQAEPEKIDYLEITRQIVGRP